jgi:hypothetical protein
MRTESDGSTSMPPSSAEPAFVGSMMKVAMKHEYVTVTSRSLFLLCKEAWTTKSTGLERRNQNTRSPQFDIRLSYACDWLSLIPEPRKRGCLITQDQHWYQP